MAQTPGKIQRRSAELRLHTAAVWTLGLSPAFFAVAVWERVPPEAATAWGETRTQPELAPDRMYAAVACAALAMGLLAALAAVSLTRGVRGREPGDVLLGAALVMLAGPPLAGLLGDHGGFGDWRLWLPVLLVVALRVAPSVPQAELLPRLRRLLRCYTWGSLAALLVAPGWATIAHDTQFLRLDWLLASGRLAGLTNHPILLGMLAAAALVLELAPVLRRPGWAWHAAAAGAVLILAQSRTAWAMALVALPLLYRRERSGPRVHPLLKRLLMLGGAGSLALLVSPGLVTWLSALVNSQEISSVHGRTLPWQVAWTAFDSSMLFGYGPSLFLDPASPNRGAYDHAHNQLLQTLGTSGLVGAAGLAVFLIALVAVAWRGARTTGGLTLALTALVLVACLTDGALRGSGFSPQFVSMLVLLAVLHSAVRDAAPAPLPRPAPPREATPAAAAARAGASG